MLIKVVRGNVNAALFYGNEILTCYDKSRIKAVEIDYF